MARGTSGGTRLARLQLKVFQRCWQFEVEYSGTLWATPLATGMLHWHVVTAGFRTPKGIPGPKMLVLIIVGLAVRLGWQKIAPAEAA